MIAMSNGKVIRSGKPQEIMTPEILNQVFQIDAVIAKDPRTNKPICITYDLIKGEL